MTTAAATASATKAPMNGALRPRRLWKASRSTVSAPQVRHSVGHALRRGRVQEAGDLAVGQEHDTVRMGGCDGIVRHHDDGLRGLVDDLAHELEHLATGRC